MNYFDIIIIAFIGVFGYFGFKRGIIKTVFETLGLIIAFFISKALSYIVEGFLLNNTKLLESLKGFFADKGQWLLDLIAKGKDSMAEAFAESIPLPDAFKSMFIKSAETQSATPVTNIDGIVNSISETALALISFLITFLMVYLLLLILVYVLDSVFKLPVLNIANKGGGIVVGLLKAVLILYIIFAIASPVIAMNQESGFVKTVQTSKSGEIFYKNNFLLNFIAKMQE